VRVVFGVGQGVLFTGYFTLAADLVPPARRTEGIALFGTSGLLPIALNAFVALAHVDPPSLRWIYPGAALVILASLVVVARLPEPSRPPADADEGSVWAALRQPRLLPVWLATGVFAAVLGTFMTFVTVLGQRRGLEWPAAVWLPYAIGAISVRVVGARLPDRVGPHNLIAPAIGLYVAALLVAARATTDTGFLFAGFLGGLAHGACFPIVASQTVSRAPLRWRGSVVALFTAVWQAAEMGAPPLAGALADAAGDDVMFSAVGVAATFALVPWLGLEHTVGRDHSERVQSSS
jgi:predicted MFS family arabinose efflux permease